MVHLPLLIVRSGTSCFSMYLPSVILRSDKDVANHYTLPEAGKTVSADNHRYVNLQDGMINWCIIVYNNTSN